MKRRLTILIIFLLVFFVFTACTNKAMNSQTPEAYNSKPQVTQQIQLPAPSPSKEVQLAISNGNAITKTEILSFFNSDNEFATKMLHYAATDMNSLEQVMRMILPPLWETYHHKTSFDVFNEYTKKYINKTYADTEFEKFAANEYSGGPRITLDKRELFFYDMGSEKLLIKNVDITGNDSALITCSWGFIRDEPEKMIEISFNVQFGRANSQLFFKSIKKQVQPTNKSNAITKAEILTLFNDDNEFAIQMLFYPATDMNSLKQVMMMILYPLVASHSNPISFDVFNRYTSKYLNKTYADSEFTKFATDEEVPGLNANIKKRDLYISGVGGEDILIKNIEITGNDSVLFNCSRGLNRDYPDTMRDVSFSVQFGRTNSKLYMKSISKQS